MIKITHVITGLGVGGAENMLKKVLVHHDRTNFKMNVIALKGGPLVKELIDIGIEVCVLDLKLNLKIFSKLAIMRRTLKRIEPNIIQSWMYHADLFAGIFSYFMKIPIIWGIRQSNLDVKHSKKLTRFIALLNSYLSYLMPAHILSCSDEAKKVHVNMGYCENKISFIPNGFELEVFTPKPTVRNDIRIKLEITDDCLVIGMVARYDPQKDFKCFIDAAALFIDVRKDVRFVLIGSGVDDKNEELMSLIQANYLEDYFILMGMRSDVSEIINAFDLTTLTAAYGEGFPNVIGESMACGIPCVVTDVGDSKNIIGDSGYVVEINKPKQITAAWLDYFNKNEEDKNILKEKTLKIITKYDIKNIVIEYQKLYLKYCK